MDITPLVGTRGLAPVPPAAEGGAAPGSDTPDRSAALPQRQDLEAVDPQGHRRAELKALTAQAGLELRIEPLPDSDVTVIKMVEPGTGRVVREFPPEGLATALAELRARATARLDHKA
jgi:hypothetical protein